MDGDGDLDVLSASYADDKIAWYENTDGDGSFGSEQVISTAANGATSVFAADVDGDGDLDVLSASYRDDKIAWYENTDGRGALGPSRSSPRQRAGPVGLRGGRGRGWGSGCPLRLVSRREDRLVREHGRGGELRYPAGHLHGACRGHFGLRGGRRRGRGPGCPLGLVCRRNRLVRKPGGQFALATADTAPAVLLEEDSSDLLEIVMTHRGRAGDSDEELATLELLFEEAPGDPLSSAEANALIETLAVYRDTGSGVFEAGSDTLVGSTGTLSLTAGTQTLTLSDGDPDVQVVQGNPGTFFAVVTLTSDANGQTPHQFRVTHVTESSSTAEDRGFDIPLSLEYAADFSSRIVLAASSTSDEDGDGLFDIVETDTGVYVSPTDTGTDPLDGDSDGDGFSDGSEVAIGTDPNDPDVVPSLPVPALGIWGRALLLLVLAGIAAGGLRLRRCQG